MALSHKRNTIRDSLPVNERRSMHKNQAEIDRIQSEIMQNKKQPNIEESLSWYDLTYSII